MSDNKELIEELSAGMRYGAYALITAAAKAATALEAADRKIAELEAEADERPSAADYVEVRDKAASLEAELAAVKGGGVAKMRLALEHAKPYVTSATWRGMRPQQDAADGVLREIESALSDEPICSHNPESTLEFAEHRIAQLESAIEIKDSALDAVIAADAECFDYTAALVQVKAARETPLPAAPKKED